MRAGAGSGNRTQAGRRLGAQCSLRHRKSTLVGAVVLLAGLTTPLVLGASPAGAFPTPTPACPAPVITGSTAVVTCAYDGTTGADGTGQTWTVPAGVTEATFDVYGAQGGSASIVGGEGGETKASMTVTADTIFSVVAAGQGGGINGCPDGSGGAGGFGGGGAGGSDYCPGGGGGGGSSVSTGGTLLLEGGGGGGGSNCSDTYSAVGGAGGGLTGDYGQSSGSSPTLTGGAPGTQSSGGVATGTATSGGPGQGGAGGTQSGCGGNVGDTAGGGGGGGYNGGAGGDGGSNGAGGGGGSGYAEAGLTATYNTGVRSGNGVVTITYISPATPAITTTPSATSITLGPTPPTLKDTALLSGGNSPTGTITFTLYSPGGTLVNTETVSVSGNGSYTTTPGYTLPTTGTSPAPTSGTPPTPRPTPTTPTPRRTTPRANR